MNAPIIRYVFTLNNVAIVLLSGLAWHLRGIVSHWKQAAEFERQQRLLDGALARADREADNRVSADRLQELKNYTGGEMVYLRKELEDMRETFVVSQNKMLTLTTQELLEKDERLATARRIFVEQKQNIKNLSEKLAKASSQQLLSDVGSLRGTR